VEQKKLGYLLFTLLEKVEQKNRIFTFYTFSTFRKSGAKN
jgi:hypothetical protein